MGSDALSPGDPAVVEEKERLRDAMRARRRALSPDDRARLAARAEAALFGRPELAGERSVLVFYAFGTELPTRSIASRILEAGKRLLLPYLTADGEMEAAEVAPAEPLEVSSYGPREPPSRVAVDPAEIDVVVVPGLAFDRSGNRLGYGGGHYDRYLGRLRSDATRIGLAFSIQLVARVPVGAGDRPVDVVVTDEGAVDARPVQ